VPHLPQPEHAGKKPCEGPLPETSEAEPSRCCSSPISESTATTRSGRIIHEPTRLDQDADYVEQLGPLRDVSGHYCRSSSHVTKDDQIEALTAAVSELHEQSTKVHDVLRTVMATHTREMNEMEATSKRSMASSSLPRRAWRSCATRRLVVPNRRCRRRSCATSSQRSDVYKRAPPKHRHQRWRRPPRRPLSSTRWSR
jgi:hypothetical protein